MNMNYSEKEDEDEHPGEEATRNIEEHINISIVIFDASVVQ